MAATKILVVEDESIVATAIKNELEHFGYVCSGIAASADEAVDRAVHGKPNLVLMDIHLKGKKDGIAAAREIHGRLRIPVVFLSAFADPETVARAGGAEPFGYLVKPYEEQELRTTIEMALAKHRAEQRLEETDRWLTAILEGIDDAVIATDASNNIRIMNLAAEAITGSFKEDALGESLATVCNLVEDKGPVVLDDLVKQAVSESRTVRLPGTTRLAFRDGRETPIEGCLSPIHDAQGEFLGMALTFRSISARVELERVRGQSAEQERQPQERERSPADGAASHLSDLLTETLGSIAQVLSNSAVDPGAQETLRRAETAAQQAAELVERLLVSSERPKGRRRSPKNGVG